MADSAQQCFVELAVPVVIGGAGEFIVEAERVEETAQHRVVVMAEAFIVAAERVRDIGERLVEMRFQRGAIRNVFRDLAHSVHVV